MLITFFFADLIKFWLLCFFFLLTDYDEVIALLLWVGAFLFQEMLRCFFRACVGSMVYWWLFRLKDLLVVPSLILRVKEITKSIVSWCWSLTSRNMRGWKMFVFWHMVVFVGNCWFWIFFKEYFMLFLT